MGAKAVLTSKRKTELVLSALEDKKAIDPVVLDVRGRTLMADFFVIASGTSRVHIQAVADAVIEKFGDKRAKNGRVEGYDEATWVLLDYGDVIVHVFASDQRESYKLESYWSGAEKGSPQPATE